MLRTLLDDGLLTCPACRSWREGELHNAPLAPDEVLQYANGRIEHGFLRCTSCRLRFPVMDGVAMVFADVGAWLRQQERAALWREDLPAPLERWMRGAWLDDEDPNWHRQMLAVYGRGLAPDTDPLTTILGDVSARSAAFVEARRRALIRGEPLVVDAGCGIGVHAIAAAALGARVIAMDVSLAALKLLARLLRDGRAEAPAWRHGGGDFVPIELRLPEGVDPARVAVLATDVLEPPLRAASIDVALAWNVVDNVANPVQLLRQLHGALRVGGTLAVATPYDWSPRCTERPQRLGESIGAGPDPADALRALLTGGIPELAPELRMEITLDEPALPWVLHRHRRSAHVFLDHYVEAVRR